MNKKQILSLILGLTNLVVGTLLTIFVVPNQIPILFDFNEKIVYLTTKWILLILCIVPMILSIIVCSSKKHRTFILRAIISLLTYENMLVFIYLCLEKNLNVGDPCSISMSLFFFFPLAVIMLISGTKVKNEPYKSKFGIRMKYSLETDFLWKQTQYYARDVLFFVGFALTIISIIFSFFKISYIEIPIFTLAIAFCIFRIRWYAKSMYKKYIEMKERQENNKYNINNNSNQTKEEDK